MVLIRVYDMPEACFYCVMSRRSYSGIYHECRLLNIILDDTDLFGARNKNCPLEEIVTCKECSNYIKGTMDEDICIKGHEVISEDFYCADAEKE